jgi:hypothetical protein
MSQHKAEVFLEKSSFHTYRPQQSTWVEKNGVVYEGGQGSMLVIHIWCNCCVSKWIIKSNKGRDCSRIFSFMGPKIQKQPNTSARRGPPRKNAAEWGNLPDTILNSGIAPNTVDYHGKFNADILEALFKKLCIKLRS